MSNRSSEGVCSTSTLRQMCRGQDVVGKSTEKPFALNALSTGLSVPSCRGPAGRRYVREVVLTAGIREGSGHASIGY